MADSEIVGWLSRAADRWYAAPPSPRQTMGNIRAVRVVGPDPQNFNRDRYYTVMGPFPGEVDDLADWLDSWIENNYGELA